MAEADNRQIDHDGLFKEVIGLHFFDYLQLFHPEYYRIVDLSGGIEFLKDELRTRIPEVKRKEDRLFTDVIAKVKLDRDAITDDSYLGRYQSIIIDVEPQSSRDYNFGERLLNYKTLVALKYRLPVLTCAVLSYDTPKNLEVNIFQQDFFGKQSLEFRYDAIQLNRLNWRDFADRAYLNSDGTERPNAIAAVFMAKMARQPQERAEIKATCYQWIAGILRQGLPEAPPTLRNLLALNKLDSSYREKILFKFVDSYLELNEAETSQFNRLLESKGVTQEVVMFKLKEEEQAEARGEVRGEVRGETKASKEFVKIILQAKSINVDAELEARLDRLEVTQLKELGKAAVNFTSLQDLTPWLEQVDSQVPEQIDRDELSERIVGRLQDKFGENLSEFRHIIPVRNNLSVTTLIRLDRELESLDNTNALDRWLKQQQNSTSRQESRDSSEPER